MVGVFDTHAAQGVRVCAAVFQRPSARLSLPVSAVKVNVAGAAHYEMPGGAGTPRDEIGPLVHVEVDDIAVLALADEIGGGVIFKLHIRAPAVARKSAAPETDYGVRRAVHMPIEMHEIAAGALQYELASIVLLPVVGREVVVGASEIEAPGRSGVSPPGAHVLSGIPGLCRVLPSTW